MRMRDLKMLEHVPDDWPVYVVDEKGILHHIPGYIVTERIGDVVILKMGEDINAEAHRYDGDGAQEN